MSLETLLVFIPIALMAIAAPGQDFVFIVGASLSKDKWNGVFSSLGIGLGNLVWVFLAVFGVATLFQQSVVAEKVFMYAGASYLMYIGFMGLKSTHHKMNLSKNVESSYFSYMKKGFITNLLNPKCAIFLLAFLPRFIDESRPDVDYQILLLGLLNTLLAILFFSVLSLSVNKVKHFVEHNDRFVELQEKVTSYIFIGLGLSIPMFDLINMLN